MSELENIYQDSVFVNEIKYAQSFLKNESTKIDVLSASYNLNNANLDTVIQNAISNNQQYQSVQVITNLALSKIEQFKNFVNNSDSVDVLNTIINNSNTNILNDAKTQITGLIQAFNISEIIKQEIISQVNNSSSLVDIENLLESNTVNVPSAETRILKSVANENKFISNLMNSVSETFKNEIINNKIDVENYINIALVEYLQNKFEKYQSSPVYRSETYLESLTKFIKSNVTNSDVVLGTVEEVARYAAGDQLSVNNLIKTVDNLYKSGTFNNVENKQLTYETFEKNNIEFLNTINNAFSNYNVEEISTTLNNLSTDIISSTQSSIENISNSMSSAVDISNFNINNLDEVENLINNINEYQSNNTLNTREEIVLNSLKSYVANEYVKISMLQNIINQTPDIKQVYTYNSESSSQTNLSQEEKTTFIQNQNQEFLNQYTQEFITENLSSGSSVSNVTNAIASNYFLSNLSTQAVEVVNSINQLTSSSEINNYSTRLEEKSFNEAKTLLSTIMQEMGKTEISQLIVNSVNSSDLKNIVQNNFNNLNTFEKNVAEKTLNEAFYISNKLNEAINIFNQDVKENSTNISSYIATQTLTNLIQNYVNNQVNNSSISIVNNLPKTNVNQAYSLSNALSIINKEDVVNNLLTLNQNAFSNNNQESRYQKSSFRFDQEFKDSVQNITKNTNVLNIATELNTFKKDTFNNIISTVIDVMNQTNTKIESYENVINDQYLTTEQKIENILESLNVSLKSEILSTQEIKNLEMIKSYMLNETYKIDFINKISPQFTNIEFDQEFKDTVQNITTKSTVENIATELSTFKQEVFNNTVSTVNEVMNQSNTKVDSYEAVVNNQYLTADEKIENILESLNVAMNSESLSIQETKKLEMIRNYVLSESYKIDILNKISSQDLFNVNNFESFENEITSRIQQSLISPSFIESVNNFRTQISQKNSAEEIKKYSSEQKTIVLNDVRSIVSEFVSVVNPEYLTTENLNTINSATTVEQISNIFSKNKSQFSSSENTTISNILNQSSTYSEIIESVTNSILNDNNYTENILIQKVDNVVYEAVQRQINNINEALIRNIITNIEQSNISETTSNQEINNMISSLVNSTLNKQEVYLNEVLNSFNISNINQQISTYNQQVIRSISTAVQNYDVSKLLTNTINENISLNQNIVNNEVIKSVDNAIQNYSNSVLQTENINENLNISENVLNTQNNENVSQILRQNNSQKSESNNYEDLYQNISTNEILTEEIKNSFSSNLVRNLFNRMLVNELTRNSTTIRTLLEEKNSNDQSNLVTQYLNKIYQSVNQIKSSVSNEVKNEVERIENITLNFENQTTYQRSSIQVYDDITNKIESILPNGFDKVNLNESINNSETNTTNNDFRNITVVKQIDENEDVQVSNLRIEKVWNKFVQEEVTKIVEEVNNQSESTNQENIYNQQNTIVNQNSHTENYNSSEHNFISNNSSKFDNVNVYNSYNSSSVNNTPAANKVDEKIKYQEITEVVFNKIEEKLKTYNVTKEDVIILKHKILTEVTEYYEKKSKIDLEKSEEKLKKEMQDLFIKFLKS